MNSNRANYKIIKDIPGEPLLIQDVGPWDKYLSVTNAAEVVVEELYRIGLSQMAGGSFTSILRDRLMSSYMITACSSDSDRGRDHDPHNYR